MYSRCIERAFLSGSVSRGYCHTRSPPGSEHCPRGQVGGCDRLCGNSGDQHWLCILEPVRRTPSKKQSKTRWRRRRVRRVFEGPNAIRDFLNPENNPAIPLVELPNSLNPFRAQNVRIFGKLMYLLPLLSIKSLPAIRMLADAEAAGSLKGVDAIVESSSGNTAFALGVVARQFGIRRVVAVVPWDIAPGKLELLRLCGVEPRLVKDGPDEPSGISQARENGREPGWFNPGQYENESNPRAFESWVAPEIWAQTDGKLTVFATGLGTTGTLMGASRGFPRKNPRVTLVGVICAPGKCRARRPLGAAAAGDRLSLAHDRRRHRRGGDQGVFPGEPGLVPLRRPGRSELRLCPRGS